MATITRQPLEDGRTKPLVWSGEVDAESTPGRRCELLPGMGAETPALPYRRSVQAKRSPPRRWWGRQRYDASPRCQEPHHQARRIRLVVRGACCTCVRAVAATEVRGEK